MRISAVYTSTMRFLYRGEYADAGLMFGIGSFVTGTQAPDPPKSVIEDRQQPSPRPWPLPATGVGGMPWAGYVLVSGAAAVSAGSGRAGRGVRLR